jgi:hypothetical protein
MLRPSPDKKAVAARGTSTAGNGAALTVKLNLAISKKSIIMRHFEYLINFNPSNGAIYCYTLDCTMTLVPRGTMFVQTYRQNTRNILNFSRLHCTLRSLHCAPRSFLNLISAADSWQERHDKPKNRSLFQPWWWLSLGAFALFNLITDATTVAFGTYAEQDPNLLGE